MNILFLSIVRFLDIADRGIYTDLIRKFINEGHTVHVVYPSERRYKEQTGLNIVRDLSLLKVKTLNIQKTGFIEKGLAILILEWQFLYQIKKHYSNIKFDLVLYSTPPITFTNAVKYIKFQCGESKNEYIGSPFKYTQPWHLGKYEKLNILQCRNY